MASDIAISAENLSKCYRVGHNNKADPNATLRDQIALSLRGLARKTRDMAQGRQIVQGDTVEDFWALRNVSFEIPRGARVGILGRNGAGKSTLLKLLSRITEPTSGRIKINGRVASLLEVGTGFHPELTGRENIFLNGAILGMSRREIQSKFDEIVDFAEVERFLDTPVKRYSSGMYVRLAFAVAAHLEPEILIVDEVLAVGDVQFQKKCLGKMGEVADSGRTVLFVSHNTAAIAQLCNTAFILQRGELTFAGSAVSGIDSYLSVEDSTPNPRPLHQCATRSGNGRMLFEYVAVTNAIEVPTAMVFLGEALHISFGVVAREIALDCAFGIIIKTLGGSPVCAINDVDCGFRLSATDGATEIVIVLADINLFPGRYTVDLWAGTGDGQQTYDYIERAIVFEILGSDKVTAHRYPKNSSVVFLTPTWASRLRPKTMELP